MEALVMMLFNTKLNKWHPIFYFEKDFPGGFDSELNQKVIRYKSKGHHTVGFETREGAIDSINNSLVDQIKSCGYTPNLEIDIDLEWDGEDIPADIQTRVRSTVTT